MTEGLTTADLLRWRLHAQHLTGPPLAGPVEVVEHLLAVQAQDLVPTQWSLGQRCGADAATVVEALDRGALRRTHVLRPTWHLATPADLAWLLDLTAARVHQVNGTEHRRHGLDLATRVRCEEVVVAALTAGPATREELQAHLAEAGLVLAGPALAYAVMHVELEGRIASGPARGTRQTLALLDPPARPLPDRDTLLVELAARFVGGRGPSTVEDLAAWASLTRTDARRAVELAGDRLERVEVDARTFLVAAGSAPPARTRTPAVHLLGPYDEHLQHGGGLADPTGAARRAWEQGTAPHHAVVTVDGAFAGWWRRFPRRSEVRVEVVLPDPLPERALAALDDEGARLGQHLGTAAVLDVRLR